VRRVGKVVDRWLEVVVLCYAADGDFPAALQSLDLQH